MKRASLRSKGLLKRLLLGIGVLASIAWLWQPMSARAAHYKVFLNLSYSGNVWHAEAANGIKALAATPPYNKEITFKQIISGADVQHQISDIQSMIAAGANAILLYPSSVSGLNRAIEQACSRHVLIFVYDNSVTAPCAYNVNSIEGRYAPNSMQWMINRMGGKGTLVINNGAAGNAQEELMNKQVMHVLHRYPQIHVFQFFGNWNDATSEERTAGMLAAHPDINAVWSKDGSWGVLLAFLQHRPNQLAVLAGQSNNGFRLALANKKLQEKGLIGLTAGSGPADGPYAFKLMMEVLTGQIKLTGHQIAYPMPWVPYNEIKMCTGDSFVNGCNVFPASKVPASFIDTSLDGKYLPELNLISIEKGTPVPGATIQKLPPVEYGPDVPGINCEHCKLPSGGLLDPTFVKPIPVPNG